MKINKKRLMLLLVSASVAACAITPMATAAELIPLRSSGRMLGDINSSGDINVADLTRLSAFIQRTGTAADNADINLDGSIDAIDKLLLKRSLIGDSLPEFSVLINEAVSQNASGITDSDGEYSDWIELYNYGTKPIQLGGYGLSDKISVPMKWLLPDVTIQPNEYLLIFASSKDRTEGELHSNFGISKDGETLMLSAPDGTLIDYLDVPGLVEDRAFGRYANASEAVEQISPTPGASNDNAEVYRVVAAPTFSAEGGSYANPFQLTIDAPEGTTVYYTTDGSDPTPSSSAYNGAINVVNCANNQNVYSRITGTSAYGDFTPYQNVNKAMIVRAVAIDADGYASSIITKTYFVGQNLAQQYASLPVISLVTDPDNLFDSTTGIYVKGDVYSAYKNSGHWGQDDGGTPCNYNQRGSEWERPASIEMFESDGSISLSQNIGIRMMGGWSRAHTQKNFRIYAREEYGQNRIESAIIPGLSSETGELISSFKTFILRAGGNDFDRTKLHDTYIQSLVSDRSFTTQGYRPCVVFLDGEYWGVYNIQEDYSEHYLASHYGVDKDDVVIIKVGELEDGDETDISLYDEFIEYVQNNDFTSDAMYAEISAKMDIQSFIDYYCTQIYIDNQDWPTNNYRMWRTTTTSDQKYYDGKWRWMLYDTEYSMDLYDEGTDYRADTFATALGKELLYDGGRPSYDLSNERDYCIINKLLKNQTFRSQFVNTFMDIRNKNFNPSTAIPLLNSMKELYRPVMNEQYRRFGPQWVLNAYSDPVRFFDSETAGIAGFIQNRYNYAPTLLKNGLSLSGNSVRLEVNVNGADGGQVFVNTIAVDNTNGTWSGDYFTDYPVTLTAVPKEGYVFTGWSGASNSTDAQISVQLNGGTSLVAQFARQ